MFSSIHDNMHLDTDDLCVHSCILVNLVYLDVACEVFLIGWNSATFGGRSERTDVRLSKGLSSYVLYKCMFLTNNGGIFLPLVCKLFLSNTSKCKINMLTCRILMLTCSTTMLTYREISFLIMMHFDSTVYRIVSHTTCHPERNVLHTDGIIDIKMTCISTTFEIHYYFNIGYNEKHSQPLLE